MPIRKRTPFRDAQCITWDKSLEKTILVLKRLPTRVQPHGGKWVDGMRNYYTARLKDILQHPPPGRESHARRVLRVWKRETAAS